MNAIKAQLRRFDYLDSVALISSVATQGTMSASGGKAVTQSILRFPKFEGEYSPDHPAKLVREYRFAYSTELGVAICDDSRRVMSAIPDESVDLVITSPPYALEFQKEYGNKSKDQYIQWFMSFAEQIHRILKQTGSFVLNIGGSYINGMPIRSLYHFKLLIELCDGLGFYLAQKCFWYNPAKLPAPAEWVNVRRIRIKDAIEYVWWLSVSPWPKADNRQVLAAYSDDMLRLIQKGYRAKQRPSGHNITKKFQRDSGGSIPSNVIVRGNNDSNSNYIQRTRDAGMRVHPARFPSSLPDFFIRFLTVENDLVLDPFAGSNTTGAVAESLGRRWIAIENNEAYVSNSKLRFTE